MENKPPANELHDLLDAYAVRELTAEEAERLAVRLRDDPAARAAYREVIELDAMLHREFPHDTFVDSTVVPAVFSPPPRRWTRWAAAAAAMLAVAAGLHFLLPGSGDAGSASETVTTVPNPVATITNLVNIKPAGTAGNSPERGARLSTGTIEIAAGHLEITFDCGAVVVLEGPARLRLEDEYRSSLEHGRVRANVPPQAIGFLLSTPRGLIRDLGTSFDVNVSSEGTTELNVLEGKVEAIPSAAPAGFTPHLVSQNEAVLLAATDVSATKFNAQSFVSDLPKLPRTIPTMLVHWSFDPPGAAIVPSSVPPYQLTLRRHGRTDTDPATRYTAGVFGSALTFDGTRDTAVSDCPGVGDDQPRTVSLWARIPADSRTDQRNGIVSWGRRRTGEKWQLCTNVNTGEGTVGALRQEFEGGFIIGSTDLRDGLWHHLVVVFHGGENADVTTHVKLYVDGRLETLTGRLQQRIHTRTRSKEDKSREAREIFPVIAGRHLGQETGKPVYHWRGSLDELRIFSAALRPAEIVSLQQTNALTP